VTDRLRRRISLELQLGGDQVGVGRALVDRGGLPLVGQLGGAGAEGDAEQGEQQRNDGLLGSRRKCRRSTGAGSRPISTENLASATLIDGESQSAPVTAAGAEACFVGAC
jgi:hypothetical protein